MALIIGCVSQKGGVGKSTLARAIAREYAFNEWKVKIADMDSKQLTSVNWNARRNENNILPELEVQNHKTISQALRSAIPLSQEQTTLLDIWEYRHLPREIRRNDIKSEYLLDYL